MITTNIKMMAMVLVIAIAYCSSLYSQTVGYAILNSKMSSSSNVILKLIVYGKSKKNIDIDAQYAAVRTVLFDGCPNTPYSKALMEEGESTSIEKYPQYFEGLYGRRYSDFIASYEATSAFKKGDKKKGTEYTIEVKVLNLRKDLEKNGIKRKLGI